MAVPFSNTKLRVPKGFQNILECLAREVLRSQPDNVPEFAAAYFENMMKARAETGHDPAVHGAKLDDRNYNNEAFKKRAVDPSNPEQNDAALKIQTQFRQHSAKEEVSAMKEDVAATRIQAGFRGFLDREEVRKMKDDDETATPDGGEEVDIDLNDPEVEQAAIKIQAGFKGFKARKEIQGQSPEGEETQLAESQVAPAAEPAEDTTVAPSEAPVDAPAAEEEEIDIDLEDPETAKAALKIQAGFRGFQARKELESAKDEKIESAPEGSEETEPAKEADDEAKTGEEEEEIDIDLNDPEVEKAATKIQAGFKGFKARKEMSSASSKKDDDATTEESPATEAEAPAQEPEAAEQAAEESAVEPETQTVSEEAVPDAVAETTQEEASADTTADAPAEATTEAPSEAPAEAEPQEQTEPSGETEEIDIDLEDPEVEKAALKIQAGFKGFKTRKGLTENQTADGGDKVEDQTDEQGEGSKVDAD